MDKSNLILHPVRWRIIRAASGGAITAQRLVAQMPDVPQATLYRHLNTLANAGLLRLVEQRRVRGTVERVYALGEGGDDLSGDDLAGLDTDGHLRLFGAFLSTLLADYVRYLQRGDIDLYHDGVGFRQRELHLSDEEFAGMAAELRALLDRYSGLEPEDGRVVRLFTTVVMPAGETAPNGSRSARR